MAGKPNERRTAQFYYVELGMDGKEVAQRLKLSENTVSTWVKKYGWKALRDARINSITQRTENIKRVISNLSEQAIQLQEQRAKAIADGDKETIKYCDEQAVGLSDQVSKWNKALERLDNDKISLETYLYVMEEIFKAMQVHDHRLYMGTLDFQEAHIQFVSTKLG